MRSRTVVLLLMTCGLLPRPVAAQFARAPVTVTADPLPLKQNAEGVLNVHVVALAELERLEITVTADRGVALVRTVPTVSLANVKRNERRDVAVPVRLTAENFGLVSVAVRTTSAIGVRSQDQAILVGTRPPPPARVPVGQDEDLANLTLLQISGANAVVRFDQKSSVVVTTVDHLGRNKADIVEIAADHIVLEETFVGPDGNRHRDRVTLKVGEKGGTRTPIPLGTGAP